ncbi:MAG: aldehyde dehydrogenase [Solirubrobacteraceae bacterium]|jgi:betaine-aldehyde dehydrogenase|nr:aldehyde dehydrogenase [Solirubrobacteraceae bacterium]
MSANGRALIDRDRLYVGGEWVVPRDGATTDVIYPFTEEPIGRAALAGPADLDRAVRAARDAFDGGPWPRTAPAERAAVLRRARQGIEAREDELARLATLEVGAPAASVGLQLAVTKAFLDWHADQADVYPWEEDRPGLYSSLLVRREPVGVVGAIVPWNFPLALTMPKLCPALLTGCTVVLKPAEETPLYAFLLAEIFEEAGLPPGVLNVVPADRSVSEELVRHPLVDKVSFTGSTRAGSRIGAICGGQIKRCSLELGGKSAAIILDDADIGAVITELAPSTMRNSGQACVNQTRVLAPRTRYAAVVDALAAAIGAFAVGDPEDPATFVGPLVSAAQRDRVESYIAVGRREGARVVVGGGRPAGLERGYFVEPTVFVDVDNAMRIAQEEIFGPVVAVIPYDGDDDAITIANATDFGLSGSVWSADPERARRVAKRVRTGNIGINQFMLEIAGPFGGFKRSGLGREYGIEGIDEYVELQQVTAKR